MLLVESFEEATDLILEGIDTGDISLILEASKKFDEALTKYTELIEVQRTIYGEFPNLAKAIEPVLTDIEKAIKEVKDNQGQKPNFKANWGNLLKLTSPWNAGKTSMASLSTQAAKLDILSKGLLECVVLINDFCTKYKEVFTVNAKGFMVNQDVEVSPDLKLSDIAGKKGEELINALLKGGGDASQDPLFDSQNETEDDSTKAESIYYRDGEMINEILGFGGGGSSAVLELVASEFPNMIDQMDETDARKAAKTLYDYFKGMADDAKEMSKAMLEKLTKLEPSKDLQTAVKGSGSSWLPKIFQKAEEYQLKKEESQSIVGAILETPMSSFVKLVSNIRASFQKAPPAEVVKVADDAQNREEEEANETIEGNDKLNQANQAVEEVAEETGIPEENITTAMAQTGGDPDLDATIEKLEDAGVDPDQAKDVAEKMKGALQDNNEGESSESDSKFEAPEMKVGRVKTALGNFKKHGLNQAARSAIAKGLDKLELVKLLEAYDPGKSLDQVIKDLLEILPKLDNLTGKEKGAIKKIISVYSKPSSPAREKLKALLQDEIKYQLGGGSEDAENDDNSGYKEDLLKGYRKKLMATLGTMNSPVSFTDEELKKVPSKKRMMAVMEKENPTENGLIPKEKLDSDKISDRYPKSAQDIATDIGIAESIDMERWLKLAGILKD